VEENIIQTISATTAPRFSTREVAMVGPRKERAEHEKQQNGDERRKIHDGQGHKCRGFILSEPSQSKDERNWKHNLKDQEKEIGARRTVRCNWVSSGQENGAKLVQNANHPADDSHFPVFPITRLDAVGEVERQVPLQHAPSTYADKNQIANVDAGYGEAPEDVRIEEVASQRAFICARAFLSLYRAVTKKRQVSSENESRESFELNDYPHVLLLVATD
jgi:hypothetical protein